ncbi:MAG: aspartate-semialdehyde dehydrogenase [Alphaproteobacteria bacterium]|nr:aspartate-semialdehyde dehydrogenase [Alphaproteobacteria bacterium]MCL2505723.1 aspartate-semialdehyde dehydrogenase [Alphaproteobacteria bacterium]
MKKFKVAVMGATGVVGKEMLNVLAERKFPVSEVVALASQKSAGKEISFGEKDILTVKALDDYDFTGTDICLASAGGSVSEKFAPKAAKQGCVVIDNTSFFRMDPEIPLVVPEVNPDAIAMYTKRNIIANPNCSTIQMLLALKPLHDIAVVKRVVVSTYQSVSGAGKDAMDELFAQTRSIFVNDPITKEVFKKQIAFNVIPQIDVFLKDGSTKEEWKMVVETQKILDPNIKVSATCVRVPVFICHSEAVSVEFEKPISAAEARKALMSAKGVSVVDRPEEGAFITAVECTGDDAVFVSRIRQDSSVENGLNMWIVSDNLRKGAALNAVQIAEILAKKYLK